MDNIALFEQLLHAESEEEVDQILEQSGLLDESNWPPLGFENNFSAIGNQQSDPSGALVEKIINSIDAVLMAEAFSRNINPESASAPKTMISAVEQFFNIRDGRLENLSPTELTSLADNIHLIATGSKDKPNYLIIDRGEGQTPGDFPNTFVSLMRSNKIRIPFVQGKFNSGGTGILQFCGNKNYQLVVSRRHPMCLSNTNEKDLWGFTLVRRLLPTGGRKSSMYVYLAPNNKVPTFKADGIKVLPGKSQPNHPPAPYENSLPYGTCVKLYNYRWRAKTTLTTEGRYELERFLHAPCLPFRITETRDYRANYYSATVIGGWTSSLIEDVGGESRKLEDGFPAFSELNVEGVGNLPYQMAVFKEGTNPRHVPNGIFFIVNGQVHGALPSDFITRKLNFDYLSAKYGALLVSVDCTTMNERVREDFFMSSRDRIRKNEVYNEIEDKLADALKRHPGLQEINQNRRKRIIESHLSDKAPVEAFQQLLKLDPTLSNLFASGDHLVTSTGPSEKPIFKGKKFPTFFRLANEPREGLIKECPINRTCRIEFETDAVNDYFKRADEPGKIIISPPNLIEQSSLWNGHFEARFRVPWDAKIGDEVKITVKVSDLERDALGLPFISTLTIKASKEVSGEITPGAPPHHRAAHPQGNRERVALALPKILEINKEDWEQHGFTKFDAIRMMNDGQGGFDCLINIDNAFLLTEISKSNNTDKPIIKFWFTYGLVLAAMGMIRHQMRVTQSDGRNRNEIFTTINDVSDIDLDEINMNCNGLAQVIVPIIRTLYRGPTTVVNLED